MNWWNILKLAKKGQELKSFKKALKKKWQGNIIFEEVKSKGQKKSHHHKLRVTDTMTGNDIYPLVISKSPRSTGKHSLKFRDIRRMFLKEHEVDLNELYPDKKKKKKGKGD